nr:hypothetical protein [Pseudomonas sp. A46]
MASFVESLKKGVKAAKDYDKNQKEIQAIFEELERSIKKFTNNKVGVAKAPSSSSFKSTKELVKAAKAVAKSKNKNGSIFLYSTDNSHIERIADWHQIDSDFSFSLIYEGKQIITKSTEQLKVALGQLLESPSVGSALMSHDKSLSAAGVKPSAKTSRKSTSQATGNTTKQTVKAAAKPAGKATAKRPAEGSAKPAKQATKPTAAKPAARPAAKPVAKPAPKARIKPELAH